MATHANINNKKDRMRRIDKSEKVAKNSIFRAKYSIGERVLFISI